MKFLVATLVSILAVGSWTPTVLGQSGTQARQADARRSARQHRRARHRRRAPRENRAISEALGELEWGMTSREVFELFEANIQNEYLENVRQAHDAIEEDDLRAQRDREIRRLRSSYLRFDGDTTGWERSFLKDEFFHNGGLSMLTVRDSNSQNFYFFHDGKLFKWFKAFSPDVFRGRSEDEVERTLQGRFGNTRGREDQNGAWLEWRSQGTRLRAVDQRRFYGIYALVFEDVDVAQQVAEARPEEEEGSGSHPLVEAVTGYDGDPTFANADVVDQITGRTRTAETPTAPTRGSTPSRSQEGPARLERRQRGGIPTIRDRDQDDGAK